jgi:pyridoxamine 5'-phosphate oxidase
MTIDPAEHPIDLLRAWLADAEKTEPNDPTAMAVASVDPDGRPSVRMVLMRGWDERGIVFYTNLESRKGRELQAVPHAAAVLHWKSQKRQIRIEGPVELVEDEAADAYFHSRHRGSQIGAWASEQSRPMAGKGELLKRVARFTAEFGIGKVPRPPHWSGFRIRFETVEFWQEGRFRLHDRLVYRRSDGGWRTETLYP